MRRLLMPLAGAACLTAVAEEPFVILRSYGLYEANRSYTERVFAAQERHPGLIDEIWFAGCGDPFSTPGEMGRVAAKGNLAARERCRRLGIRFSYQDGVTLNHGQDGIRRAGIPEDAWAVDRDGKTMYGVFCCTSPFVKDFCREKTKAILSALRPASYWPDDDLRMNKGGRPPASCFCSRCLGLFGARVGKSFDREGLLAELTGPAASAETRRAWCAFNGEMLGAFAEVYREAADAVSPETLVGQQLTVTSPAVNGDWWRRILEAYGAGGRATGVRPGGGYYSDQNPFSLVGKMVDVAKTAARASRLGCVKQICYEAETWPHIGSLKSPGGLMAECAYALAAGCDSLALYWGSDINGETAESHDFFFDTLAAWKPFLLAEREAFRGTVPGGLAQFVGEDRFADDAWTTTFDVQDAVPLARNGIPLADAEGSPDAFFLNARSVRTLSRGDFATAFAKPVLMDVGTFSALAARFPDLGFMKKVRIGEPPAENAPATDSRPAGYERFAGGRCEGVRGLIRPQASDVVRLSEMTADPAACGTCVIPTEFGGTVVLVQDMSFKSYSWAGPQMSWAGCRRHGILDALDRAMPGRLPARLLTDGYACVVLARKTPDGRTAGVFVMNFGTGETPPLELGIRRTAVRDWTVLGPRGRVTASGRADGDGTVIRLPPLPAFGVAVAVATCKQE